MSFAEYKNRDVKKYLERASDVLVSNSKVGVELEYANGNKLRRVMPDWWAKYWAYHREGSVRNNGGEAVFKMPFWGEDIMEALRVMSNVLDNEPDIHADFECSAHVHVDCNDLSDKELSSFVVLLLVFSPALRHFVGEERVINGFCTPTIDSTLAIPMVLRLLNAMQYGGYGDFDALLRHNGKNGNNNRYTDINLTSLDELGSIEVRMLGGTTDMNRVITWINILLSIKEAAKQEKYQDFLNLAGVVSGNGTAKLMHDIFGLYSELLVYDGLYNDLMDTTREVQYFYLAKDVPGHNGIEVYPTPQIIQMALEDENDDIELELDGAKFRAEFVLNDEDAPEFDDQF